MHRVLITGANSYIGSSFHRWVDRWPHRYDVKRVSLRNRSWRDERFCDFDTVLHTAALVHTTRETLQRYLEVNRDLTLEVADKAKEAGVRHFIFLSTMGIYGLDAGHIDELTKPCPRTPYAQSKYQAEISLSGMSGDSFRVAVIRPPMVYGRGCPGNYRTMSKAISALPMFPSINNVRSMIFIDNLSEMLRQVIDSTLTGPLWPQNDEYVNITHLAKLISQAKEKRLLFTKVLNPLTDIGLFFSPTFRKVFGSLTYDMSMRGGPGVVVDGCRLDYQTMSFEGSIVDTEQEGTE